MRKAKTIKLGAPQSKGAPRPRRDKDPKISFGATGRIDYGIDKPRSKKPARKK